MKEVLYNSLLKTTSGLTIVDVIINFAAAVIACLIYISYRVSHSGPVYSDYAGQRVFRSDCGALLACQ